VPSASKSGTECMVGGGKERGATLSLPVLVMRSPMWHVASADTPRNDCSAAGRRVPTRHRREVARANGGGGEGGSFVLVSKGSADRW
jgi:hypothetical protein